jgi:hypothetical protein
MKRFLFEQLDSLKSIRTALVLDLGYETGSSSYVAQAMRKGYEEAALIKSSDFPNSSKLRPARAAHNARTATIGRSILGTPGSTTEPGTPNVFKAVNKLAVDDFHAKFTHISEGLQELLKSDITDRLMDDFNSRHDVNPLSAEDSSKPRTKMLNALQDALKTIDGEGKRLVAECEEWERSGNGLL